MILIIFLIRLLDQAEILRGIFWHTIIFLVKILRQLKFRKALRDCR